MLLRLRIHALFSPVVACTALCTGLCAGHPRLAPPSPARYAESLFFQTWRFQYIGVWLDIAHKCKDGFCTLGILLCLLLNSAKLCFLGRLRSHRTHRKHSHRLCTQSGGRLDACRLWKELLNTSLQI